MSILYIEELFDGRAAEDGIERKRKIVRRFEVATSSPLDGPFVAGTSSLLPRNGDSYPDDEDAVLVKIRAEQSSESPTLFYVTCEYDTELPREQAKEAQGVDNNGNSNTAIDPTTRAENPLDRPPTYKISFEETAIPMEMDAAGNAILNSAKDPFDPPLMTAVAMPVLNVTLNVAQFNFNELALYNDSVNSKPWRGFGVKQAKLTGIAYESRYENSVSFWQVTYTVKIRAGRLIDWRRRVIDRGFNTYTAGSMTPPPFPAKKRILADPLTGGYPTEPQLLDGTGQQLAPGGKPVFLVFDEYLTNDFTKLGI